MKALELLKIWAGCMLIVCVLAGSFRILIETDGLSQAGRARFAQKYFQSNPGRLLAAR